MKSLHFWRGSTVCALVGIGAWTTAQNLDKEAYVKPPDAIADLVNAPRYLNTTLSNLSPDHTRFLITNSGGMPPLSALAKTYFTLGGVQVDANANRSRNLTTRSLVGMELYDWAAGKRYPIQIPENARVTGPTWSTDGKQIAFLAHFELKSEIWVADAATGKSHRISAVTPLAVHVTGLQWVNDNKELVSVVIPDNRQPTPRRPRVTQQPRVMVSNPAKDSLRTYRGLLETQYDQLLLEYYSIGQLARIDVKNGSVVKIGEPKMILSVNPAPDGKAFIVRSMQKPFSYLVPTSSFGTVEELWDEAGKTLLEIRKTPLRTTAGGPTSDFPDYDITQVPDTEQSWDEQGRGGGGRGGFGAGAGQGAPVDNGRRSLSWRPDGQGLSYLQLEPAKEGGGARQDQVLQWVAPYGKDDVKVVYKSADRISSVAYSADMKTLFLGGTSGQNTILYAVNLDDPTKKTTITSVSSGGPAGAGDDFYTNPGSLMRTEGPKGIDVVQISGDRKVFLSGTEYNRDPEKVAPRPFIDAVSLADGKKERIWQSSDTMFETVGAVLDADVSKLVLTRQSSTVLPDSWLYDRGSKDLKKLTDNKDYMAAVSQNPRYRFQVTRADGFKFWVKVTTPKWFVPGTKAPAMFWFYPSEYASQQAYDNPLRTYNKNTFPTFGNMSIQYLSALGYVVVEPDCPIVGPQARMNDFYLSDLRNNLAAIINDLDKRGLIDRDRLGIGGHSYGAFSTAHALIQTPYFKAGIAGDGCYNRTLTPFAFQSEQRLIWETRELYTTMSSMLYAENMNGALLMYHGLDDMNVGTNPINSERMFNALEALGKTASLYMYPYEDHGPLASETLNDIWARWVEWLDKYVKNAGKEAPKGEGGNVKVVLQP